MAIRRFIGTGGHLLVAAAVLLLAHAGQARAGFVTFDPTPVVNPAGGKLHPLSDHFVQDGMYLEGFWAVNVGTASAMFRDGHFHIGGDTSSAGNVERQHLQAPTDLQGILLERADGGAFSLDSLDIRVRATGSISGYSPGDVQVLIATSFDPMQSVASQFTGLSVGTGSSSFSTLNVTGFDNVTRVFISSSASVSFDSIRTTPVEAAAVPGPPTVALLGAAGLILAGAGWRRRAAARA